jgi:hypothetical protein
MKTAKDIFEDLVIKAKKMNKYTIERAVPEGWFPLGKVPFDMFVSKGEAEFTLIAETKAQAEWLVDEYLNEQLG